MKRAGTESRYKGSVGLPRSLRRPAKSELDLVSADFPEVAPVLDLARLMVEVDSRFDNLKAARGAGWHKPADHPDVDPPHEALTLAEQFREAGRLRGETRTEEFRRWLGEAEPSASELDKTLRSTKGKDSKTKELADKS